MSTIFSNQMQLSVMISNNLGFRLRHRKSHCVFDNLLIFPLSYPKRLSRIWCPAQLLNNSFHVPIHYRWRGLRIMNSFVHDPRSNQQVPETHIIP